MLLQNAAHQVTELTIALILATQCVSGISRFSLSVYKVWRRYLILALTYRPWIFYLGNVQSYICHIRLFFSENSVAKPMLKLSKDFSQCSGAGIPFRILYNLLCFFFFFIEDILLCSVGKWVQMWTFGQVKALRCSQYRWNMPTNFVIIVPFVS